MDTRLPPTVSINGNAIRQIREDKKLTQLYVAKVVGVTTDTISRWENNRYPTIKRENVLRLAEALEVDVAAILHAADEPEAETGGELPGAGRSRTGYLAALLIGLGLLGLGAYFLMRPPPELRVMAQRHLPRFAAPGSTIPVWIEVDAELVGTGYIVRERFPAGWKLIEANPPASSLDNVDGVARWIVKPGEERHRIAYLLQVGPGMTLREQVAFAGEVVAKIDGQSTPARVGGESSAEAAPYIWADSNGDNRVDDNEMLQASDVIDEMQGVHIDWNTLEQIWDAGHYRWREQDGRFLPERELSDIKTH